MIWLVILSMLVMAAYTAAVCIKQKGVPYSISATYYKLEHKYWFMATMWLTAGLLMPAVLEVSKPGTEWLAFLACAGMFFIGAAPNFKDIVEGGIHKMGAILCLVGSQAWVADNCPWCLLVWIAYVGYTVAMMVRNENDSIISDFLHTKPMFWIEVAALTSTYLSIFICL
ncbi:glycosyl transferase [Parabacteroides johnsonii]|uniref:glycosyl transferase n=1 Tax=Parabacteroides johnsonii TaxID=387661 RepID=UPI0021CB2EBF|nr:glycosyl transferase [Parabacteroides johnsonii]